MKIFYHIIICALTLSSCMAQKNTDMTINYEAFTRGSSVKIDVNSQKLVFQNFEGEKQYTIDDKKWQSIQSEINKIELDGIKNLKAPSTKSHTDAALIATLKIKIKDKTYESNSFDHGNPPKEIKSLIDVLFSIAKMEQ